MSVDVAVVRVFTDETGNFGNPLGIVNGADVPASARQEVATRLGFSETVFVDLPAEGSNTAHLRIFTPAAELPFAGHPSDWRGGCVNAGHRSTPCRFPRACSR